jgi:hypothetical protein
MENTYTDRIKERIGESVDGREDYFDLTHEESINLIKEKLKNNFSVNLWTFEWPNEQIAEVDKQLYKENIIHCWDEVFDSFVCFNTEEDMVGFYWKLRKEATDEQLKDLKEHNYNTPVIKWFKDNES